MRNKIMLLVLLSAVSIQAIAQFDFLGKKRLFDIDINDIAVSPDGRYLIATANHPEIRVFRASNLTQINTLHGHEDEVYTAAFCPNGKYLATAGLDNQIIIWDLSDWSILKRIQTNQEYITALAFNPSGTLLASAANLSLKLFDATANWESITDLVTTDDSWSLAFSDDGKYFAAGVGPAVRLWKTKYWAKKIWTKHETLYGHRKPAYSLDFSPDGKTLATAGADSVICLWSLGVDVEFRSFKAHDNRIQKIAFDNEGKYLISGSSDKTVKVWNPSDLSLVTQLDVKKAVADIATFPNVAHFAVATTEGWVQGFGSKHTSATPVAQATTLEPALEPELPQKLSVAKKRKEKRIALLIGNAQYTGDNKLANPIKDVDSLAHTLGSLGFEVTKLHNLDRSQMIDALNTFGDELKRASTRQKFVVSMFYYSGHGVQYQNESYLIPVSEKISGEEDIEYEGVKLERIFAKVKAANSKVNIVVVDACRNNPFRRRARQILFQNTGVGMGQPNEQPNNILLAYSTSPSKVAMDGRSSNSPYVNVLLRNLRKPIPVEEMFKEVRRGVSHRTRGVQMPWTASTLLYDFSFGKP